MPRKVHDHVSRDLKGDRKGHYTANFLRPVVLHPQKDTIIRMMIVRGGEIPGQAGNDRQEAGNDRQEAGNDGSLPLGVQLLQATLLTNVVYPIDAFGEPIRHFCPG